MFAVFWLVEIFTDAEWPTNKQHRKPTSIAIHLSMELRLHGANLLFLCPQLQVNFIAWCQVVWMESTSKHAWNFWLARKLNSSNGLTTARQDSWFGDFSCIETWTKSLPARWWIRNASKIQNLMLTVLQTTRDGSCWDRSTVEKLRNRTCLLVTEMADTARQQGRRNSADKFHAVAAIYQKKKHADFFSGEMSFQRQVLKWRYEDWKIPNGESMIKAHQFKEECVEFSLLNMRQHGMTSTYRDECVKFSHTSARPLLVKKFRCPLRSEGSLFQGCWNWIYGLFTLG